MLSIGRFAPLPRPTTPHTQDEIYVILSGRGVFFHDGKRDAFEAGDLLFVAAGVEHRLRTLPKTLSCGSSSMVLTVAKFRDGALPAKRA